MPLLTRRDALLAAGMLPLSCLGRERAGRTSLASVARSGGRFYGAAIQAEQLRSASFREVLAAQCDSLTPELALKWDVFQPGHDRWNFAPMDRLSGFAREHGKRLHGHTLLWHRSIPAWAAQALDEPGGWTAIDRYFGVAMPRYAGLVDHWDVVNEPIDTKGGVDGLRDTRFLRAFGPDYILRALESARMHAPSKRLLINEYGLEYPDAQDESRRHRLIRLVDDLQSRGAPLGGIGFQAHLSLARGRIDRQALSRFLEELAGRGLFVLVTELDVREADFGLPVEERDRRVAATVREFLEIVLDQPAVRGIATWGLSDRHSWLNEDGEIGTRHRGGNRGLPLDADLRRKPFFDAMVAAFAGARPAAPPERNGPEAGEP